MLMFMLGRRTVPLRRSLRPFRLSFKRDATFREPTFQMLSRRVEKPARIATVR
jgi:hypothetical protein